MKNKIDSKLAQVSKQVWDQVSNKVSIYYMLRVSDHTFQVVRPVIRLNKIMIFIRDEAGELL